MARFLRVALHYSTLRSTFTLHYSSLHYTVLRYTTLHTLHYNTLHCIYQATMAQLNGSGGAGLLYKPRQYQYEMFEASLKENIIVAVCSRHHSSFLSFWVCLLCGKYR